MSAPHVTQRINGKRPSQIRSELETLAADRNFEHLLRLANDFLIYRPDDYVALNYAGQANHELKNYKAAEACYLRAYNIYDKDPALCSNMGNLYQDMRDLDQAVYYCETAYKLSPDNPQIIKNLANKHRERKEFETALKYYEMLRIIEKDDPDILFNIGLLHFYLMQPEKGSPFYEQRMLTDNYEFPDDWSIPEWDGKASLKNKTILILEEQGFGDTILFSRFLPKLIDKGANIIFKCRKQLHRLFEGFPCELTEGKDKVIEQSNIDYYLSLASLANRFEPDWQKWPPPMPISIAEQSKKRYDTIKNHTHNTLKIAISWSGNPEFSANDRRSVSYERFLHFANTYPDIQFYSFIKGAGENDLVKYGSGTITPLGHTFSDFSDTAAMLEHMDMIIMTDSALAHLGGSMDVPVLDLMDTFPYWIYFPEVATTPLYKSVRFIRQTEANEWDPVFNKVHEILGALQKLDYDIVNSETILQTIDTYLQA